MSEHPSTPPLQEEDILLDHNYDGIQEFDNPLPGWWKAIFLGTILFAVPYTWWYHFAEGNSIYDQYEADVAAQEAREAAQPQLETDAKGLLVLMQDDTHLARGKATFSTICLACHAADGGGVPGLGPNLCDDFWKNVKVIEDIPNIIRNGVPGTAMAPQVSLSPNQVADVAAYVASLRGTTPANPKEPEGEKIAPWGN